MLQDWYSEHHLIAAPFIIPQDRLSWLTDPGSLVSRMQQAGVKQPTVTILREAWLCPMHDESQQLALEQDEAALVREILIGQSEQAYVFARSIFPQATLTGEESELGQLGTRTLGSVLFKHPLLKRSGFEIAWMRPQQAWHQHIAQYYPVTNPLWGRRSLFSIKQKKLMVTEVFLPAFDRLLGDI